MKPFYFGSSERPLFGIHHEAASGKGPRRTEAIVLCHPFGREYLRAHRAMRELALRLAADGFHVIRFDYFGTGDSAGEGVEATVEQWLDDIGAAVDEVRDASGLERVSLIGARLGAGLAAFTAKLRGPIARLVLWDPILDGKGYLRELVATQRAWALAHPVASDANRAATGDGALEVLGFPLTRSLADGIAGIDMKRLDSLRAERILVVAGAGAGEPLRQPLQTAAPGADVATRSMPGNQFWLRQEGINQALVPSDAIAAIENDFVTVSL